MSYTQKVESTEGAGSHKAPPTQRPRQANGRVGTGEGLRPGWRPCQQHSQAPEAPDERQNHRHGNQQRYRRCEPSGRGNGRTRGPRGPTQEGGAQQQQQQPLPRPGVTRYRRAQQPSHTLREQGEAEPHHVRGGSSGPTQGGEVWLGAGPGVGLGGDAEALSGMPADVGSLNPLRFHIDARQHTPSVPALRPNPDLAPPSHSLDHCDVDLNSKFSKYRPTHRQGEPRTEQATESKAGPKTEPTSGPQAKRSIKPHAELNAEPYKELSTEPSTGPHSYTERNTEPHRESHTESYTESCEEPYTASYSEPYRERHPESHTDTPGQLGEGCEEDIDGDWEGEWVRQTALQLRRAGLRLFEQGGLWQRHSVGSRLHHYNGLSDGSDSPEKEPEVPLSPWERDGERAVRRRLRSWSLDRALGEEEDWPESEQAAQRELGSGKPQDEETSRVELGPDDLQDEQASQRELGSGEHQDEQGELRARNSRDEQASLGKLGPGEFQEELVSQEDLGPDMPQDEQASQGELGPSELQDEQASQRKLGPGISLDEEASQGEVGPDIPQVEQASTGRLGPGIPQDVQASQEELGPGIPQDVQASQEELGPGIPQDVQASQEELGPGIPQDVQASQEELGPGIPQDVQASQEELGPGMPLDEQASTARLGPDMPQDEQASTRRLGPDMPQDVQASQGEVGPGEPLHEQAFQAELGPSELQDKQVSQRTLRLGKPQEEQASQRTLGLGKPQEEQASQRTLGLGKPQEEQASQRKLGPGKPQEEQASQRRLGPGKPQEEQVSQRKLGPGKPQEEQALQEELEPGEPQDEETFKGNLESGNLQDEYRPGEENYRRDSLSLAIKDIKEAIQEVKTRTVRSPYTPEEPMDPVWVMRQDLSPTAECDQQLSLGSDSLDSGSASPLRAESTNRQQLQQANYSAESPPSQEPRKSLASFPTYVDVPGPCDPEDLIDGIIFAANYLGSTQLLSDKTPSKNVRMTQAQEAVRRVRIAKSRKKCPQNPEVQSPVTNEVDLFISTQRIKVLNADSQEAMMDHPLRTISYIADIGDIVVLMARRRKPRPRSQEPGEASDPGSDGGRGLGNESTQEERRQYRMICHVFESEDAQLIAQSIGQAFSVAYQEFLRANGIDPEDLSQREYSNLLNTQDMYNDDLIHFSKSENCKDVHIEKQKGEILGVVVVESGWGSILPTVIIANMMHGGPAEKSGRLSIGDQIMSVNSTSLVGLPLTTCQSIIKGLRSQPRLKLNIVRCPPVTTVLIRRPDLRYQLGFSVQNGIICSLMRGGIAERGGVRVGHRIIEISGQSVVATPHERIVNILSSAVGEIHMKTMPAAMYRLLTGQEQPVYI